LLLLAAGSMVDFSPTVKVVFSLVVLPDEICRQNLL